MTRTAELLAVVLVTALVLTQVGKCAGKRDQSTEVALDNAYKLAREARPKREALARAKQETDRARTALGRAQELVSIREQQLEAQLDSNDTVLANVSADTGMLRIALQRSTETGRGLLAANALLRDSLATFVNATLVERVVGDTAMAHEMKTTVAFKEATQALDCRVLTLRCPSRMTSAGLGGLAILGLVLLL